MTDPLKNYVLEALKLLDSPAYIDDKGQFHYHRKTEMIRALLNMVVAWIDSKEK